MSSRRFASMGGGSPMPDSRQPDEETSIATRPRSWTFWRPSSHSACTARRAAGARAGRRAAAGPPARPRGPRARGAAVDGDPADALRDLEAAGADEHVAGALGAPGGAVVVGAGEREGGDVGLDRACERDREPVGSDTDDHPAGADEAGRDVDRITDCDEVAGDGCKVGSAQGSWLRHIASIA